MNKSCIRILLALDNRDIAIVIANIHYNSSAWISFFGQSARKIVVIAEIVNLSVCDLLISEQATGLVKARAVCPRNR
jgi:hypothetical protein